MGNESPAVYMKAAIRAANKLRTVLESKITGPFTVVPRTIPGGPIVITYLSAGQSDELTELVKENRSPFRGGWLNEFFTHYAMDGSGDIVIAHWKDDNNQCPDKWEKRLDGDNLFQVLHYANEHAEACGK